MKLTGKCKEEFEKWYNEDYIIRDLNKVISNTDCLYFYLLTKSMQCGVLVDYFDSVGICININVYKTDTAINQFLYDITSELDVFDAVTRIEARAKSIEKANQLRNEQLK